MSEREATALRLSCFAEELDDHGPYSEFTIIDPRAMAEDLRQAAEALRSPGAGPALMEREARDDVREFLRLLGTAGNWRMSDGERTWQGDGDPLFEARHLLLILSTPSGSSGAGEEAARPQFLHYEDGEWNGPAGPIEGEEDAAPSPTPRETEAGQ